MYIDNRTTYTWPLYQRNVEPKDREPPVSLYFPLYICLNTWVASSKYKRGYCHENPLWNLSECEDSSPLNGNVLLKELWNLC